MLLRRAVTRTSYDRRFIVAPDAKVSTNPDGMVILRLQNGEVFKINQIGTTIWSDIAASKSVAEICNHVSREHEMELGVAREDVANFLQTLLRRRLIRKRREAYGTGKLAVMVARSLAVLIRYDLQMALFGFGWINAMLQNQSVKSWATQNDEVVHNLQKASAVACSLYWKRVRCLQRAVLLVTVLRRYGAPAQLVIGYRSSPFLMHAWAEVDGCAIDGSGHYAQRLAVLHRA